MQEARIGSSRKDADAVLGHGEVSPLTFEFRNSTHRSSVNQPMRAPCNWLSEQAEPQAPSNVVIAGR